MVILGPGVLQCPFHEIIFKNQLLTIPLNCSSIALSRYNSHSILDFIDNNIQSYSESHTSPESDLLKKINRDTYANVMMPRMLSGHLQGRILSMFSKMLRPKTILEIGTYTGYSALCLAEGLVDGGHLITLDINEELESKVRTSFAASEFGDRIDYRIGDALDLIPHLDGPFDLVFIDADKINYTNYFDLTVDKMPVGGVLIADNVLWSGKVVKSGKKKMDKDTLALIEFNDYVQKDSRVENVLMPLRDGLMMIRKL